LIFVAGHFGLLFRHGKTIAKEAETGLFNKAENAISRKPARTQL
jgi:hypothetical protein